MTKSTIILISALCFVSLFYLASSKDQFFVEGKVYCDTCRVQFFTKVSATVKLECKEIEGGSVTLNKEAVTDKSGKYSIEADGDHEEEVCEVSLVKSVDPDCDEISKEGYGHTSRVTITNNSGITNPVRLANPLAFLKKEKLPECKEVLRELGFDEEGLPV
ncbi:olee1-like protein [Cucumis melo var. makuwa]|uniref:Olee1-like protein n=1 Tax=Cucumis melo var. makuwa TaxID=1194695 RepID=A0A5D3CFK7_CUCMM|nr:olee1-like protein [Cucumis melo var. makuwa]